MFGEELVRFFNSKRHESLLSSTISREWEEKRSGLISLILLLLRFRRLRRCWCWCHRLWRLRCLVDRRRGEPLWHALLVVPAMMVVLSYRDGSESGSELVRREFRKGRGRETWILHSGFSAESCELRWRRLQYGSFGDVKDQRHPKEVLVFDIPT